MAGGQGDLRHLQNSHLSDTSRLPKRLILTDKQITKPLARPYCPPRAGRQTAGHGKNRTPDTLLQLRVTTDFVQHFPTPSPIKQTMYKPEGL